MARLRERVFAGFGALLFLVSTCAFTIYLIMSPSDDTAATTSEQTACVSNGTEETLEAPEVYIPAEDTVAELQSTDLTEGTGAAAKAGDCLVMKYYGTLASDGTMFDENFTDATAFAFTLGQGEVIEGWDQGLVGMKEGGMRRLVIPAALAYRDTARGSIPANSDLVFQVKLLRIQK